MKKIFIFFLGTFLFCAKSYAQAADEEAIKKICMAETQAYLNRDYASYASYHVQSKDDILAGNTADSSFFLNKGWEKISKDMKDYFRTAAKSNSTFQNSNYVIKISGSIAIASYESKGKAPDGKVSHYYEFRTLLKKNNSWKILGVQVYINYKPE